MERRTGTVVNGGIVLDDAEGLVEGASVTDESDGPVTVTDAELELIGEGLEAADRGELIDARAFLSELRREG